MISNGKKGGIRAGQQMWLLLGMALLVAFLTYLQPSVRDDYWYAGQVARTEDASKFAGTGKDSAREAVLQPTGLAAAVYEWRWVTGRYTCGALAGTMCRWPQELQALFNGGVWAVLLALVFRLCGVTDNQTRWGVAGLAVVALIHFEPVLWRCGKFNYLWSAAVVLVYDYWLRRFQFSPVRRSPLRTFLVNGVMVVMGLIAGGCHEVMVVPLALVAAGRMFRDRRVCWPFAGLFVGVALNVLSPSNWARASCLGTFAAPDVGWLLVRKGMALLRALMASPWAALTLVVFVARKRMTANCRQLALYVAAIAFTVAISDCAGRAGWGVMVYGLLLTVGLFPRWRRTWCVVAVVVATGVSVTTAVCTWRKSNALSVALDDWQVNPHHVLVMEQPVEDGWARLADRSFHAALGPGKGEPWQNAVVAAAYGRDELVWLTPAEWQAIASGDAEALAVAGLREVPGPLPELTGHYGFFERILDRVVGRGMARGSRLPEREVLRTRRPHETFSVSTPRGRRTFAWVGRW